MSGLLGIIATISNTRLVRIVLGAIFLCLIAGCVPVAPPHLPPLPQKPAVPASTIVLPLSLPLQPLYAAVEEQLPKEISSGNAWIAVHGAPKWLQVQYYFRRGDMSLHLTGKQAILTADLYYRLEARRTTFPKMQVKDGSEEHLKHAVLTVTTDLDVAPNWHLTASSHASVRAIDHVHITFLDIDITHQVMGFLEKGLDQALKAKVDPCIVASPALCNLATHVWQVMSKPYAIADGVWWATQPDRLGIDQYAGTGDILTLQCQLIAHPNISMGTTAPGLPSAPLPPNTTQPAAIPTFHLALEGSIKLETAKALLRTMLFKDAEKKQLEFTVRHRTVRITDIDISGSGPTMLFTLHFTGSFHGAIYLLGTVHYDPKTQTIYASDIDYSLETKNLLAAFANELMYEKIKKQIAHAAVWSIAEELSRGENMLTEKLNHTYAGIAQIQGQIRNLQPLAVYLDQTSITAALQVDGEAQVTLLLPVSSKP